MGTEKGQTVKRSTANMVFSASLKGSKGMSSRELSGSECTPESTLEFFISHDYICKLVFDSLGATGVTGC